MLGNLIDPLYRFRMLALVEGVSYLLILFVTMPMKYYMGIGILNKIVGWGHGILFVIYIILAFEILIRRRINFWQFLRVLIASIIPFGTFFNEKMLKEQQQLHSAKQLLSDYPALLMVDIFRVNWRALWDVL